MQNKNKSFLWLGIMLILTTGFIHVMDAPDSFEDAIYKGWLFYANGLGAVISAYGIYRAKRWGWDLGLVIAAGSFILYVASRTAGLPQIPAEPDEWLEPLGVLSLGAEGLFVAVFVEMKSKGQIS